jgi:hypothetical protein
LYEEGIEILRAPLDSGLPGIPDELRRRSEMLKSWRGPVNALALSGIYGLATTQNEANAKGEDTSVSSMSHPQLSIMT